MIEFPLLAKISAALLLVILGVLALLHFYWMVGGKWGFENAVPRKENGALLFVPSKFSCFVVGFGLLILFYLIFELSLGLGFVDYSSIRFQWVYQVKSKNPIVKYSMLVASILFMFRGIGDFKYVGLFKKIKDTEFARLDNRYYSPLCFLISGLFFLFHFYRPYLQIETWG